VQRGFDAFNEDFDCAEGKEAYCHWQLHKEYLTPVVLMHALEIECE
jgi:hypothetical protein